MDTVTAKNSNDMISRLLRNIENEGDQAYNKLFPIIYQELKEITGFQIRQENGDLTINQTDLVHEFYLKWKSQEELNCESKRHLMALASNAMHQILVDHARRKLASKRGGGASKVPLDEDRIQRNEARQFLELEQACQELKELDKRMYNIVELKYFCGFSISQVAEALDISISTVDRDWKKARALLYKKIKG